MPSRRLTTGPGSSRGDGARLQRRLKVPARYLMIQRVAFGLLGVLTSLDATVALRTETERWILDND